MTRKLFLALACMCLLAACGHSPSGPTSAASSHIAPPSTSAAPTASAVTVGCGTYCQQAGESAGTAPPGYPCAKAGCLRCPSQNCVTLESGAATATNGVATVRLKCNLSTACHGALLLCLPSALCENRPGAFADGGRLAGSDFTVPAGTTANVGVALTDLGKQGASQQGLGAKVMVDLLDYGTVLNTALSHTVNFTLTSTDPPSLPAGATASCGNLLFVGPGTSCPFAKNVKKAYTTSTSFGYAGKTTTVKAFSPVTGKTYAMHCTTGSLYVCRGGTNALVEFYYFQ
jgi:hypothetical protein